jgi:hypothetical protein
MPMKYTVEQVARMTGLSTSTVRQYAWKMGLGEKKGNRKFYTKTDALKIKNDPIPKTLMIRHPSSSKKAITKKKTKR